LEALKTTILRVREALETGADILTSACTFCKRNVSDAVKDMAFSLKVLEVVELA
jgi:heterodisulfide reductase subunit D